MSDVMTFEELKGPIKNKKIAWLGDGNNVVYSLIEAAVQFEFQLSIACPKGYEPNYTLINKVLEIYENKSLLKITNDPFFASSGANILYTDVWSSMGEENQKEQKDKEFNGFTINANLLSKAAKDAIVQHCLPAYRGKEITDEVIESKNSRIFEQAENRMHVQQALLSSILS